MYRRRRTVAALIVLGVIAAIVVAAVWWSNRPSAQEAAAVVPSSTPLPTPTETPLTPAQELLSTTDDPLACAVTFVGEEISQAPILQTQQQLYTGLPIPRVEGRVFAGWYSSADAAAELRVADRVNGSELVVCDDQEITLHGGWTTPEANAAEDAGIPILMYHQFTALPEGEDHWLRLNYAYVGDFEAHMKYISEGGFYLPTWDELSAFIDGELYLPSHSVIVTDDDADQTWFDLAVPIVDRYGVLSTSFMITAHRQDPPPSPYVLRRSHTHDMHQAGANGDGMLVNASADEIAADLQTSAEILGVGEVVAYPFGHHNQTTKDGVAQAGYALGRTIEQGYVRIGTDRYALPVIRINYGMGLDDLIWHIG